jgi:hypothetical protein
MAVTDPAAIWLETPETVVLDALHPERTLAANRAVIVKKASFLLLVLRDVISTGMDCPDLYL